jgi:hypothetical protein
MAGCTAYGGKPVRGMPLRGEFNEENTCRPGDIDLTPGGKYEEVCGVAWTGYTPWFCTRAPHSTGQHVAGNGKTVLAIWQPDGSGYHDYRESMP